MSTGPTVTLAEAARRSPKSEVTLRRWLKADKPDVAHRRAEGTTFAATADGLNTRSVPTARGGSWHPSTAAHVARSVALDAELTEVAA